MFAKAFTNILGLMIIVLIVAGYVQSLAGPRIFFI